MRSTIGQSLLALLLLAGAGACWMASRWERGIAHADHALATFASAQAEYDGLERSMRMASWLPGVRSLAADVRRHRAAMQYWHAQYDALDNPRDPSVVVVETDPQLRLMAANAAYRQAQRAGGDPQTLPRRLDGVIKQYGEVLRLEPGNADAAFNYEYVARARGALTGKRGAGVKAPPPAPASTIHGYAGAPPPASDMTPFKTVVPQRPEERKDVPRDAGKSNPKKRKG